MKKYLLSNPLLFAIVMQDPKICKGVLERILPERKIREIRFLSSGVDSISDKEDGNSEKDYRYVELVHPQTEKRIIVKINSKSVCMDVLFEDDDTWYNLEMQVSDVYNPRKRSRYYHSIKDVDSLKAGQEYDELKPGYVIFICLFDLFKKNRPAYFFEMRDENGLRLEDGQYTIFMNAVCTSEMNADLASFYRYLRMGEVTEGDELVCSLDDAVSRVTRNEEVQARVTLYDDMMFLNKIIKEQEERLQVVSAELEAKDAELEAKGAELEAKGAELEASRKFQKLVRKLVEAGRTEEILKAEDNEVYRLELFREFRL